MYSLDATAETATAKAEVPACAACATRAKPPQRLDRHVYKPDGAKLKGEVAGAHLHLGEGGPVRKRRGSLFHRVWGRVQNSGVKGSAWQ